MDKTFHNKRIIQQEMTDCQQGSYIKYINRPQALSVGNGELFLQFVYLIFYDSYLILP